MSWKSRTSIGVLTATVLTGAGVATMASALASAQPPAPAASVAPTAPTALDSQQPADQLRTEQLTRSVEDLLAQIRVLEQAVAAGAGTPTGTPSPTPRPGRERTTGGATTETEPTTAPPQGGLAPTEHPSETSEPGEPSDD
jgi:hypothetical protein